MALFLVFLNTTATTEIHTYWHTLPLHDALPIRITMNHEKLLGLYREEGLAMRRRRGRKRATGTRAPTTLPQGPNQRWSRSEEHTYELQSLMRISYAFLCL